MLTGHTASNHNCPPSNNPTPEVQMDANPAYPASIPGTQSIKNPLYITTGGEDHDYDAINDDYYTVIINDQNVRMTQNPACNVQEDSYWSNVLMFIIIVVLACI